MFTKINKIDKFAVFDGFIWDTSVRDEKNDVSEFKELNIIYGRNYSGKTTLSRIFRSIEKGELHEKYPDAAFDFSHSGNDRICQLDVTRCSYDVRVYNRDFISDNLKWLLDEDGTIKPFAILGESNILIEEQLAEKLKALGSEEKSTGLKFDLKNKTTAYIEKKGEKEKKETAIDKKLKDKANKRIKTNPIYKDVNYNITKIKTDITKILMDKIELLEEKDVESKKKLLKEESKANIPSVPIFNSSFDSLYTKADSLLSKEIKPTKSIQALLNDAILQEWVRSGIEYHKNIRTKCAFCGSVIPVDLWDKLDAHFSKESESLRKDLEALNDEINTEKRLVNNITNINQDQLYSVYHDKFKLLDKDLVKEIKIYVKVLDKLSVNIESRMKNIFDTTAIVKINNNSTAINDAIKKINALITKHNEKSKTLSDDQNVARTALRLNEVHLFIKDIDYVGELKTVVTLSEEETEKLKIKNEVEKQISKLEREIDDLKTKLKDERQGAEKVNEYLNHYFGHKGLRLVAVENAEDSGIAFQIFRGDEEAHNLSEGECSLVAFCYFIARLEDIDTKDKELIIWIDDPVSSLDYNHIFFIFSLIESVIAKPYRREDNSLGYNYKQLFISTHNLDFLKYLKRLSRANKKSAQYFLIDKINEKKSKIRIMPDYLKRYITEFNYLFHQIYKCTKAENANEEHECFYNFGNNLRKFLDAYLFYRYPANQPIKEKLDMFFKGDQATSDLTHRLENELSHLEEIFDRSMRPIDIPEIPKLANFVLSKIKEKDGEQYNAMLKSIGAL